MRDGKRGRGKVLASAVVRSLIAVVVTIVVPASLSAQQQGGDLNVTPPPLRSVNSDKSLWTVTGIYVGFGDPLDGDLTGFGGSYEHSLGDRSALLFSGIALDGSFDALFTSVDFSSVMLSAGYKWTIRPSRVYADDGTVVDAQVGAAAYGSISYMQTSIDSGFFSQDTNDTSVIAGIMADIPLGRRFSVRPNLSIPSASGADPIYGVDLAFLGGLEDSWEISLAVLLQKVEDSDTDVYTFTFSRKIGR